MSNIFVNEIRNNAGTGPVKLFKQTACKSYWFIDQINATLKDSFNTSSWTDDGLGKFTINFTNAFSNSLFSVAGIAKSQKVVVNFGILTPTNAKFTLSNPHFDVDTEVTGMIHGDLA